MPGGTSFWKVFFGVLAALFVAGGCVVGACLLVVGKTALDVQKTTANREAEERAYHSALKVEIHRWTRNGEYAHVRGSIHNGGQRTVAYYKIAADFYDKAGNVIDSDFTISAAELAPAQSRNFEIMQRWDRRMATADARVEEVRLKHE